MFKIIKICFLLGFSYLVVNLTSFAQSNSTDPNLPSPPPVTLVYSVAGTPQAGTPIAINVKVTPQEDMHLDINCLLPQGVEPVYEPGVRIIPYAEKYTSDTISRRGYLLMAGLWTGPLSAGVIQEFTFHVTVSQKGSYKLICLADALAKWGQQEADYTLNVN